MNIDITRAIRILEDTKSDLLMQVANLYGIVVPFKKVDLDIKEDLLAQIIIDSYLLAKLFSIDYESVTKKMNNKLRLSVLKEDNKAHKDLLKYIESLK